MSKAIEHEPVQGVRQVISTQEEFRAAVVQVAGLANRTLTILTPDLEPDIYDQDDFLETLKRFLLARSFARVRVLIADPTRAFTRRRHRPTAAPQRGTVRGQRVMSTTHRARRRPAFIRPSAASRPGHARSRGASPPG